MYLALVNGSVLTGATHDGPRPGTVLIRDDRIAGVYEPRDVAWRHADELQELDVSGLVLLPGLIDCHVHLFFSAAADAMTKTDFRLSLAEKRSAAHLRAGVTTVRDLGGPVPEVFQLRDKIASGAARGPAVISAGTVLTVPGGHCEIIGTQARDRGELVAAVQHAAGRGADCIKIAVSGGVSTRSSDLFAVQFSERDLRAAVQTAHRKGLRVAAHASNPEAIRISAIAGVDSIEHAVMIDNAALEALRASNTIVVPTLAATAQQPSFLADPAIPDFIRKKAELTIPAHRESITRVIESGIPVAAGTDAGSTLTPHGSIALELEELTQCGLDLELALAAATSTAAELLGTEDECGTLESGKKADIIAVQVNPLQDISALNDIRLVVKDGVVAHQQLTP